MPTFSVIKFKNLSPLHIGTGRETTDTSAEMLHSDTLIAALAAMRVQTRGDEGIEKFIHSFCMSSAFPYWKNHLFLPKPQGRLPISIKGREESEVRKKLKSIRFIEYHLWNKIMNGSNIEVEESQIYHHILTNNPTELPKLYHSQVSERVAVARGDGECADPFYFEWTFYHQDAGLYVLTDAQGELLQELCDLLTILGEQGVGTDKSVGGGKFEVERGESIQLGVSLQETSSQLLLSLYIPTEDELNHIQLSNSLYTLMLRGGFMAGSNHEKFRHLHKKSIYMFGLGSILQTQKELKGKVVDLRPTWNEDSMHAVFRSGRPLAVPIKNNL